LTTARYNELSPITTDNDNLVAAGAKSAEIQGIKEIIAARKSCIAKINKAFQALAKYYLSEASEAGGSIPVHSCY
jgi:hypothetical protein